MISGGFHLFFTNDSVLFCLAKEEKCQKIIDLLLVYEKGLGQKINRDKTNIFSVLILNHTSNFVSNIF